jgi:hypothetical protein
MAPLLVEGSGLEWLRFSIHRPAFADTAFADTAFAGTAFTGTAFTGTGVFDFICHRDSTRRRLNKSLRYE